MADREAIKKAILDVAGNPSSGVIAEWADRFADAVVALNAPKVEEVKPTPKREFDSRETRKVEAKETR
jgi:hypothetical protein